MSRDEDLIALGVVTRAQGVRGQLRVKLHNPDSELLLTRRDVYLQRDGATRLVRLRELPRSHQGDVLLWPADCDDRDSAEALRGSAVCVPVSALPELPAGEYYHRDLIGLRVEDRTGAAVGTIVRIDPYPTVDVAVVATDGGELELPILDPYWVDVDLQKRCVVADYIEHLRALVTEPD